MGAPRQFPIEYDEVYKAIEDYKAKTLDGTYRNPNIPHFLGLIGASVDEYMDVVYKPNNKNIPLSELLKKFGTWVDGEVFSKAAGPRGSANIFYLKQGYGGHKWTDKQEVQQNVDAKIEVKFKGVNDAFG